MHARRTKQVGWGQRVLTLVSNDLCYRADYLRIWTRESPSDHQSPQCFSIAFHFFWLLLLGEMKNETVIELESDGLGPALAAATSHHCLSQTHEYSIPGAWNVLVWRVVLQLTRGKHSLETE